MDTGMIFHQLFERETSSYTYILGDSATREAIIIDPVLEMVDRDIKLVQELGLKVKYVLDTHVHADHITASGELRKRLGAKVGINRVYGLTCPDVQLVDNQELSFGPYVLKAISTPGHTEGCMSYVVEDMVFTGDALLNRGCGRTDFQEGSSEKLFYSVRERLFNLPNHTTVYPAHDYKGMSKSSIQIEKEFNPRLNLNIQKEKFLDIMANLNLANPKKIHEAVPANSWCGLPRGSEHMKSGYVEGVPTVSVEEVHSKLGHIKVVDVRSIEEFNNELGHIPTSQLATLGEEFQNFLENYKQDEELVFVCRAGVRSAHATVYAISKGISKVYNMEGGMLAWNELGYKVEKDLGGS